MNGFLYISCNSYSELAGEIIATQWCSSGTKTPLILTVTNSSSERFEFGVTFIWIKGFGSRQSDNSLLDSTRKSDIKV
jgi:hypothetical protein